MAVFHLSMAPVARSKGGSATRKAAYSTGSRLRDERLGVTHDYRSKRGVEALPLALPSATGESIPRDRGSFWRAVEATHARKDAVPARTLDAAIPRELFLDQAAERRLATQFTAWLAEAYQVGVDGGIHRMGGNHHIDLVLTSKQFGPEGFGKQAKALDAIANQGTRGEGRTAAEDIREKWSSLCNAELAAAKVTARVDHRSYEVFTVGLRWTPWNTNDQGQRSGGTSTENARSCVR